MTSGAEAWVKRRKPLQPPLFLPRWNRRPPVAGRAARGFATPVPPIELPADELRNFRSGSDGRESSAGGQSPPSMATSFTPNSDEAPLLLLMLLMLQAVAPAPQSRPPPQVWRA